MTQMQRQLALLTGSIGVAVVVYFGITTWGGIPDLASLISRFSRPTLMAMLVFSLLGYTNRFLAWHRNLSNLGVRVPLLLNLQAYFAGYLFLPTPARAGTSIVIFYLRKYAPYGLSFMAFFLERLQDFIATLVLSMWLLTGHQFWLFLSAIAAFLSLLWLLTQNPSQYAQFLEARQVQKFFLLNFPLRLGASVFKKLDGLLQNKPQTFRLPTFLGSQVLILLAHSCHGIVFYLALRDLDLDLSLLQVISIYGSGVFLGSLSFLPVGLGGVEAILIIFLSLQNVSRVDAVAATIISRLLTTWFIVGVGAIATMSLFVSGKYRRKSN